MSRKRRPYWDCARTIEQRTLAYLKATLHQVIPLCELEKAGGLKNGDTRGKDFVVRRLAARTAELRDMVTDAWRASGGARSRTTPTTALS